MSISLAFRERHERRGASFARAPERDKRHPRNPPFLSESRPSPLHERPATLRRMPGTATKKTLPTCDLDTTTLAEVTSLLDLAFAGDFGAEDLEHALGGVHTLVYRGGRLVGHGAVVQRRLLHADRALRTGYVEALAVHPEHQRRGVGTEIMAELERVVRGGFELGALSATADGAKLYTARGWELWRGRLFAMTPIGTQETPDEQGGIYVLPASVKLDLDGALVCDYRDGDVW